MLREALSPNGAFSDMAQYKQFILWKAVPGTNKDGTPKMNKFPVDPKDFKVKSAHDTSIWITAEEALILSESNSGLGVAFVFTENDPFFFIDVDKALEGGVWNTQSTEIFQKFHGAAFENSQSKKGFHIFGKYSVRKAHGCDNPSMKLGFYTEKRFVALTGFNIQGRIDIDWSEQLDWLIDKYFPPKVTSQVDWSDEPVENWDGIKDDDALIAKALKSKSMFAGMNGKASFKDLWHGKAEGDQSSLDMALAQHLAFWTGNNPARIERLMMQSGMVRDKWTERDDYLRNTILNSCSLQKEFHGVCAPNASVKEVDITAGHFEPRVTEGDKIMSLTAQIDTHFKGCVYLISQDKILVPSGEMLKQSQFKTVYGGWEFIVDNNGKTTKDAWETFTQSRAVAFPKAHMTCFRPDLPFGAKVVHEGRVLINAFVELDIKKSEGDITPFIDHMKKIMPNDNDRDIILSYMAAVVRYKGEKFQWAPLIQGVPGNGKTLLSRALEYAVGARYTHSPNAGEIGEKYNGWLLNKVFINVEDIKVAENKAHLMETLKPMITNNKIEIRLMGTDKTTEEICCNFIFNSNHKDAVRKASGERRFAIFYCPQQREADLKRDGMDGDYFPNLYKWLNDVGYERIAYFLSQYQINPKYNPAVKSVAEASAHRAPITSSSDEVDREMLGYKESLILDAIDSATVGFRGGYVSSTHIDKLFSRTGVKSNPRRYREMMELLGYAPHPNLNNGRASRDITCDDNKRSVIYIQKNRSDLMLTEGSTVVDNYINSQVSEV